MSDLMAEYSDLIEAYKKIPQQTDLRTEFETQWSKVHSLAIDGENKATGDLTAQVKEMETLIQSLTEPFSKSTEVKRVTPHTLKIPKVKLL
ncbi:MAG: hypothetical protein PHY90_05890 [Desulfitobacteriaceae bacterium]|nr:hypothetical protein [Desulfitobacteriaceae bacterium]